MARSSSQEWGLNERSLLTTERPHCCRQGFRVVADQSPHDALPPARRCRDDVPTMRLFVASPLRLHVVGPRHCLLGARLRQIVTGYVCTCGFHCCCFCRRVSQAIVFGKIYAYFLVKHASSIHIPFQGVHPLSQDWWAIRRRQHCEEAPNLIKPRRQDLWLFASEQTAKVVCAHPGVRAACLFLGSTF